jgi:DNA mismatch endonuclease (patch repair protein)
MNANPPVASSPAVAARMSRQARRDTAPELALRRLLHASGLRYRVAYPVPGLQRRTIDIAFTRARVAVFVDGCFWHGCPEHATWPSANSTWWRDKIEANRRRDHHTRELLEDSGWLVLRFWEHQDPALAAAVVQQAVRRSGGGVRRAPSGRVDPPPAT